MLKSSDSVPQAFQMVLQFLRRQQMEIDLLVLIFPRLHWNTKSGLVWVFEMLLLCLDGFVRIVVSGTGVLRHTTSNTDAPH